MITFQAIFKDNPQRNFSVKIRGICQFDVLNPCWDNRPGDVVGQHWGVGKACDACTSAALRAAE